MNAPIPARTGPSISRGTSNQSWGTPRVFIDAVEARFGRILTDLAASEENAVAVKFFDEEQDSLSAECDWSELKGVAFCNPPFANIDPWAKKCASVRDRLGWTLLLVPASVDAEWYWNHVHGKAFVMPLRGRITFVNAADPYPKGLMIAAYGFSVSGFEPWRWLVKR